MIGDYYRKAYGEYYVVVKETAKTKTLIRFEPHIGDFVSQYSDPCNRELEIRGVEYYVDEYIIVRLNKEGYYTYKKQYYQQIQLPYLDYTYID